jgi:hypothetical protein
VASENRLLVPDGDGWRFEIEASDLTYVAVNFQTRLRFGSTEVVIESPFDLTVDGRTHRLDPNARAMLGPLLAMYPDTITEASADADGVLRLTFVSGATITVPPSDQYEAWSVVGLASFQVVCTPGGELAIWS